MWNLLYRYCDRSSWWILRRHFVTLADWSSFYCLLPMRKTKYWPQCTPFGWAYQLSLFLFHEICRLLHRSAPSWAIAPSTSLASALSKSYYLTHPASKILLHQACKQLPDESLFQWMTSFPRLLCLTRSASILIFRRAFESRPLELQINYPTRSLSYLAWPAISRL